MTALRRALNSILRRKATTLSVGGVAPRVIRAKDVRDVLALHGLPELREPGDIDE